MTTEDRQCRICFEGDGTMISPCLCSGSSKFVHTECLERWRTFAKTPKQCTVCKSDYDTSMVSSSVIQVQHDDDEDVEDTETQHSELSYYQIILSICCFFYVVSLTLYLMLILAEEKQSPMLLLAVFLVILYSSLAGFTRHLENETIGTCRFMLEIPFCFIGSGMLTTCCDE